MLLYSHTHRCDYSASNSCWIGFDFFLLFFFGIVFLVLFFVFLFVPDGFRWKREIYMRSDSGYVSNKIFSPCCWALIRNIDCFWIRFWIYFFYMFEKYAQNYFAATMVTSGKESRSNKQFKPNCNRSNPFLPFLTQKSWIFYSFPYFIYIQRIQLQYEILKNCLWFWLFL